MVKIISVYGNLLLTAMGQTLLLALCGLFFACILGLFFGLLSVVKSRICNMIATVFVDIIRGVPMIVLAFFVFFGLPVAIGAGFTLSPLQAGTICLALNCKKIGHRQQYVLASTYRCAKNDESLFGLS